MLIHLALQVVLRETNQVTADASLIQSMSQKTVLQLVLKTSSKIF